MSGYSGLTIWRKLQLLRKAYISNFWKRSYSQFGEDVALTNILDVRKPGFFVDVGCWHPKKFSNTYHLYRRGWRGMNIDIDVEKIYCANLVRKGDINVVAAVSDTVREVEVYTDREFSLGTTIESGVADKHGLAFVRQARTTTLTLVLDATKYRDRRIDFLNVDIEGADLAALRGLDFERYRPQVVAVEMMAPKLDAILTSELHKLMTDRGYELCNWAGLTLIYRSTQT